jgi:hypothetical protein
MSAATDTTTTHTCDDGGFIYHPSCKACCELRMSLDLTYCVHCSLKGTLSGRASRADIRAAGAKGLPCDTLVAQDDLDVLQSRCLDEMACFRRTSGRDRSMFGYGGGPTYRYAKAHVIDRTTDYRLRQLIDSGQIAPVKETCDA